MDRIAFAETLAEPPEELAARRLRAERARALFGEDAADPIMKLGRFVLEDQLGSGGQGAVFVARDPELDRKVALKRLHATDARRARSLLEEAKALARFKHDNVVQVYEVDHDEIEGPFMVMELVDGIPLRRWLREQPRTWMEIVEVLVRVAHGLAALHEKGVVHRDVKPDNVIIDASGRVKLVDLGIALVTSSSAAPTMQDGEAVPTTAREIAGTYDYMAPEQRIGEGVDARSDQYGYCVMMHEALHRGLPHRGGKRKVQRVGARRAELPATRGRIPVALDRVLERGLRSEPSDRFESMDVLAARLEAIVRWRRWGVPAVAAGVLLVGVAGGVAWALRPAEASSCGRTETGAKLWSQARRDSVREVFLGSGAPAAGLAFATVDTMLTGYTAELDREHEQACTALVEREQDPSLAHSRLACLSRSQGVLTQVVEQLATASADEVTDAPERLGRLPLLAECSSPSGAVEACDPDELVAGYEEDVRGIGLKLQAAEARIMLGRYDEGLALAQAALDLAAPEALVRVRARAWLVHGRLAYEGQQPEVALASLQEALSLAERHACDGVAAEALTLMAKVRALGPDGDAEEALRWSQQALDKLDRLGDAGLRRADALNSRGLVLHHRLARHDEADALYREAAGLREQYLPASALALSDTLLNRGSVLVELDRIDDAIAILERAMALRIEALGPDHPGLFKLYFNLGNRRLQRGDVEAAEVSYLRAIELAAAGLGPHHRKVGELHLRMVDVLDRQGRFDQAIEHAQQALKIFSTALEPPDLLWMDVWGALGQIELSAGRPAEAIPWLRKVWELVRTHPQASSLERALGAYRLGSAEVGSDAHARGLPWLDQALELLAGEHGDASTSGQIGELHAHVQLDRGVALRELGRADESVSALDEATRWWSSRDSNPERLAHARFELARAIVARDGGATAGTQAQVDGLVYDALAWFEGRPEDARTRAELVAWMTKHGFARSTTKASARPPGGTENDETRDDEN